MSLTLREYSEKHGIKKPTVNARLKKLERNNPDKTLTVKTDNIIYLTDSGITLLDKSFNDSPVKAPATKKSKKRIKNKKPVSENSGELIKLYQETIKRLENELSDSNQEKERLLKQIDKLTAMVSELTGAVASALKDSQQLLNQEQSLALIDKTTTPDKPGEKKSILARLAVAGKVIRGDYG